jgi:RNA polymerase sigma factor (sigma-70 family)
MSEPAGFHTRLVRLREGAPEAVAEFIEQYGRALRTFAHVLRVRLNLSPADLDSEEMQQSVLASFCVRARLGQFELESENALRSLLYRMAQNKAIDLARKRRRRDVAARLLAQAGRAADDSVGLDVLIEDHLAKARSLCTDEEWDLIRQRGAGRPWDEIGRTLSDKPDTVRKRHERLVNRLGKALDLPGGDDE